MQNLAQHIILPGQTTPFDGPLPTTTPGQTGFNTLGDVVSVALSFLFPIAGLLLFVNLVWGGFQYLASRGDEKAIEAAKGRITNSLLGIILLFVAFWVTQFVARRFGIRGGF